MRWRVTITHAVDGSVVMSEPEGLVSAIIGLTRHPIFHTLVKEFKSSFRAYGSNGTQDGRRDWIKNIEALYGPDAVVSILIEYAPNNFTFETLYSGEIGIQTIVEGLEFDHYLEFTPVQTGMWRKFISRYDVPVDIQSAVDLDGNSVPVITPETMSMLSQIIDYNGQYRWGFPVTYDFIDPSFFIYYQIDWPDIIVDDFDKPQLPRYPLQYGIDTLTTVASKIASIFIAPQAGRYTFNIYFESSTLAGGLWSAADVGTTPFQVHIGRPTDPSNLIELTRNVVTYGSESVNEFSFSGYYDLQAGEHIVLIFAGSTFGDKMTVFGSKLNNWKPTCRVVATTNMVLSGYPVVDGVTTAFLDFILLTNQADPSENGMWVIDGPGWYRHPDSDSTADFINATYYISEGAVYTGSVWIVTTENINVGNDAIRIEQTIDNDTRLRPYPGVGTPESYLNILGATTFETTTQESFLVHDVAASIIDRITEVDKFYSEYIGSQYTQARAYLSAGPWWNNMLFKGVHLRGYTLSEKLFSLSFKDLWEGLEPMLNLSLGYETIEGEERIVMRSKAEAYDSSSMSVLLSGVQRIKRKYGPDYFNGAKFGANKGKTEDINGLDDPHSRTVASILKNIGRVFTNTTNFIYQSLTIEQARRTTKIKSADYKFDDDIFIVEATRVTDNAYQPRLNEDFVSVTNLNNEASRYNKHHTPARFLLRWLNYISGGLQKYLGTVFRFTGGEGNYDMVSTMINGSAPDDYGGNPLAENADILVGTTYLWVPKVFEIEHYLTFEEFKTIDQNRNIAIGISQSYEDHKEFFIDDLQFEIMSGQVKITGKFKDEFDIITVPPGGQIFQGGRIFDATFDFSFE